jgi:hypothetical protein
MLDQPLFDRMDVRRSRIVVDLDVHACDALDTASPVRRARPARRSDDAEPTRHDPRNRRNAQRARTDDRDRQDGNETQENVARALPDALDIGGRTCDRFGHLTIPSRRTVAQIGVLDKHWTSRSTRAW